MKFTATAISGAYLVEPETVSDLRGFFARMVCEEEFAQHGLNARFVQQSISFNERKGVLRGLHWQAAPYEEEKLVRVTAGAVFDVMVDLRRGSPTLRSWVGVELSAQNHHALYIPKGIAHGFQTLTDRAEIFYQMTVPYHPEAAMGVCWNDPELGIAWPDADGAILSSRDASLPLLAGLNRGLRA